MPFEQIFVVYTREFVWLGWARHVTASALCWRAYPRKRFRFSFLLLVAVLLSLDS